MGCLGLVACGSGAAGHPEHSERYLQGTPHAFWAGKAGPAVAKLKLPGGSLITFLVVECRRHEPRCHQVGYYTELPGEQQPPERILNEGPRVARPEPIEHDATSKVFDLPVLEYSCEGLYPIGLVHALLRQPRDTVLDRSGGQVVEFKKAQIPVQFHPEGVLVYGLLLAHANTIVVKAPDGRVVARQQELGADEEPHFKGATTRRDCGAR